MPRRGCSHHWLAYLVQAFAQSQMAGTIQETKGAPLQVVCQLYRCGAEAIQCNVERWSLHCTGARQPRGRAAWVRPAPSALWDFRLH